MAPTETAAPRSPAGGRLASRRRRVPGAARAWRPVVLLLVVRGATTAVLGLLRPLTHPAPWDLGVWDGAWYLRAAEHGWPHGVPSGQSTLAFFPAFPLAIRAVHAVVPVGWSLAGALTSLLTQVAMAVAIWLLGGDLWGEEAADRATLLVLVFPGAFIFALYYAEPLMLACSAVCLLALRRRWWVLAGVAGALATSARPNGVAVVVACAVAAYQATRRGRELRSLVAVAIAPVGVVAWFAYLWATTGTPTAWLQAERRGWGERVEPVAVVHLAGSWLRHGVLAHPEEYVTVVSTAGAAVLVAVLVRSRVPATWIAYTAVVLVMALMSKTLGLRPRFVLTAFPLPVVLGRRLRGAALAVAAAAGGVLLLGLLVVTTTGLTLTP